MFSNDAKLLQALQVLVGSDGIHEGDCECDNTHEQNNTECGCCFVRRASAENSKDAPMLKSVLIWEVVDGVEVPRKIADIYCDLSESLKEVGYYPDDGLSRMDYMCKEDYRQSLRDAVFPEHRWIACFAVTGDSEGHYIHVEVVKDDSRELIFLGKTFQGMEHAYRIALVCARILGA